jgi:hypothetical protein
VEFERLAIEMLARRTTPDGLGQRIGLAPAVTAGRFFTLK